MQRGFDRTVFFVTRPIKKRDQFLIRHPLDLLNSNQGRVTAEISNLLRQPLEMLVLRRQVRKQICRRFYLNGTDLLKPPPHRHAFRVAISRETEEKQEPRVRLHHVSRCVMKYVLQIIFALTSNRCFVRERTITQQSTPEVKEGNTDEKDNRSNINRRNRKFGLSGSSDGRRRKRGDRQNVRSAGCGADDNQRQSWHQRDREDREEDRKR